MEKPGEKHVEALVSAVLNTAYNLNLVDNRQTLIGDVKLTTDLTDSSKGYCVDRKDLYTEFNPTEIKADAEEQIEKLSKCVNW
jgi:hypothetical protein